MPRLTGLEVLRQLRHSQVRVPCILLSANLDDQLIQQARQANAFSVLSRLLEAGHAAAHHLDGRAGPARKLLGALPAGRGRRIARRRRFIALRYSRAL
jgi:CheY-like chemotaxis protein